MCENSFQQTDVFSGPGIGAAAFIHGSREGSTMFHVCDQSPRLPISPVQFVWRPVSTSSSMETGQQHRQLWIWTHPASSTDILKQIHTCFDIDTVTNSEDIEMKCKEDDTSDMGKSQKTPKVVDKQRKRCDSTAKVADPRTQLIPLQGHIKDKITVTSLKDNLCRFHLTGPLSQTILSDLLKLADVTVQTTTNTKDKWWDAYYGDEMRAEVHGKQGALWDAMRRVQSPAELSARCVMGLTVRDPRLFLPEKKTKVPQYTKSKY